jgi:hypothetical protein
MPSFGKRLHAMNPALFLGRVTARNLLFHPLDC